MPKNIFVFRWKYFLLTICILAAEIFIAVYINDKFIRPYAGDFLVVILLYCFLRTFLKINYKKIAIAVLLFAVFVEIAQFYKLVDVLGLKANKTAATVIGSSFDWLDIIAYVLGITVIFLIEGLQKSPRATE